MIGVIDSKICNIFSLTNMLKKLNAEFIIINKPDEIKKADKLILPGVGAFPKAMDNLTKMNLIEVIKEFVKKGKFILGICLGMQLLFEESKEFELTRGFGFIQGKIEKINLNSDKNFNLVLPHMGWNDIIVTQNISLLYNIPNYSDFYFVHSFMANTDFEFVAATTNYGIEIPAVVFNNNVFGVQFHPEKSQKWGEVILKNFIRL